MKLIPLTKGKFAKVDDEDFECLSQYRWFYHHTGYAGRNIRIDGEHRTITMHRVIVRTPPGMDTDHINGDKLDNRRENLRICSHTENVRNQPVRSNNTSGYKGVSFYSRSRKWRANIYVGHMQRNLGYFVTPEEAAQAYDKAARILFGEFARLNIPDAASERWGEGVQESLF